MHSSTQSIFHTHRNEPMAAWAPIQGSIANLAYQNRLLRELPSEVLDRLSPRLELVALQRGNVLYQSDSPISYSYFPISSIISLFYTMANGDSAQTGMVGFEGMVGISPLMGYQKSPSCAVVQCAGSAIKLPTSLLASEFERNPKATQLLLRYTQSLFIQLAQAVACNRHHTVADRFCRWLLTTLDRQCGNEIIMTHDMIANLIGTRREAVTEAAGNLQRLGIIRYRRGKITILDRAALERLVCECYAVVARHTELLVQGRTN